MPSETGERKGQSHVPVDEGLFGHEAHDGFIKWADRMTWDKTTWDHGYHAGWVAGRRGPMIILALVVSLTGLAMLLEWLWPTGFWH